MFDKIIDNVITKFLPFYEKREVGCDGYINRDVIISVYKNYQKSPLWKKVVESVKERAEFKCEDCKTHLVKNGIVHHKKYINWGKGDFKEIRDCILLCHKCHTKAHRGFNSEVPFFARRGAEGEVRASIISTKTCELNL